MSIITIKELHSPLQRKEIYFWTSGYNSFAARSASISASRRGPAGCGLRGPSSTRVDVSAWLDTVSTDGAAGAEEVAELEPTATPLSFSACKDETALVDESVRTELMSFSIAGGASAAGLEILLLCMSFTGSPAKMSQPGSAFPATTDVCSSPEDGAATGASTTIAARPPGSPPMIAMDALDF